MRLLLALVLVLTQLGVVSAAEPRPTFAIIVTSNRSLELARPDLQYADDDGARYYEVLRTVAPAERVHLLTSLDADTERLFPALVPLARPPTRQALAQVVQSVAQEVAAARRAGASPELLFVFAGHGDVDRGRGFLELADGPLYSDDLEALLVQIAPARAHVILDSCNSFFVVNARKPGGRRFATAEDAARGLGQRLPGVGVFLSTSAEGEVYEWSELQSGIFSHAVRSGLSGAADADGDGTVTYRELEAFVDTASRGIKNPAYRPKVYARGPGGRDSEPVLASGRAVGAIRVRLPAHGSARVTVRDAEGLPWVDLHKEEGAEVVLTLPPRLSGGTVDEHEAQAGGRPTARHRLDAAVAGELVALEKLALASAPASRGPGELFRLLFSHPFGPRALADHIARKAAEPPPVFGISAEDTERMSLLLEQIGRLERRNRTLGSGALVGLGVAVAGAGWVLSTTKEDHSMRWALYGTGAAVATAGLVGLLVRSPAEKLHATFVRGMGEQRDPARVVAETEQGLRELARDYRRTRIIGRWTSVGILALGAASAAWTMSRDDVGGRKVAWFAAGNAMFLGTFGLVSSFHEYPSEQMVQVWESDPGIRELPRLGVSPAPGGALLGLSGEF